MGTFCGTWRARQKQEGKGKMYHQIASHRDTGYSRIQAATLC